LASDTIPAQSLAHPFLRPGGSASADEQRRRNAARTLSWVIVGALHLLFFFFFVISIRPFEDRVKPIAETILLLTTTGDNAPPVHIVNPEIPSQAPPMINSAPITIVKPPPPPPDQAVGPTTPGDILSAVGRSLACSAGSWEHLNQVERDRCGGMPWRGYRTPNGSLVMIPRSQLPRLRDPSPDSDLRVTGSQAIEQGLNTGQIGGQGGCPILLNTPCLHPSQGAGVRIPLGGDN
jgi:hypothetical protein